MILDHLGTMEFLDQLEVLEIQVLQDRLVILEPLDQLETKELLEGLADQDLSVLKDH